MIAYLTAATFSKLPPVSPMSMEDFSIDLGTILPYLYELVGEPQLINTWSISKFCGAEQGGWHRGVPTTDYSYSNGVIRIRMFNVVYIITYNGSDAGCIVALPG